METVILESTLIKLGGLLAVGFGVAGAEIIGQNMGGASDGGGVNAMVAGGKVGWVQNDFQFPQSCQLLDILAVGGSRNVES